MTFVNLTVEGLAADDENLYRDRIKMWQDFNHAWLSLFQRQKDMMESGAPPQRGQTLISEDGLRKMGKEIVRLCDGIDRHGLVDYEYGVWEESIVASTFLPGGDIVRSAYSQFTN